MPARNVLRHYIKNGYYHVYNRGVEKRPIFLDKKDYEVFTYYLERCLDPDLKTYPTGFTNIHNIAGEADLICYVLMPNHFHFLIKQISKNAVTKLLRRVLTSYVMYFNHKYDREGGLFQGKPRAVFIKNDEYLLHLTRYIHRNPMEIIGSKPLQNYQYSSYSEYIYKIRRKWIKPIEILRYFKKSGLSVSNSYKNFVESSEIDSSSKLERLTLES